MIRSGHDARCLTAPRALALAGFLLLAASGCAPHVRVRVTNDGKAPLTELRIVGEQDSTAVRDLGPGESVRVITRVSGEDEIVLRGRIGGRLLQPAMAAYVEPGTRVHLRVDATGSVHVEVRPGGD